MTGRTELEQAIAAQERLRGLVPDAVVDAAIDALRSRLAGAGRGAHTERRRKQVTVLFADVSGSTAMSAAMDPEDVGDTFEALWQQIDRAIVDADGRIDKHIGDAVMAVWGAEIAHEDDPVRAVAAALAVQEIVDGFSPPNGADITLKVRIGINTGPVLLGDIGTTAEFTAMGDAVNVASRLEQAAPVGGILIGRDTYRHVRGVFSVAPQPPLRVKGKDEPLDTYVVTGELPRMLRGLRRGLDGVQARMVGREAELGSLQELVGDAMEGRRARLVTVVGDAGIGKSRLLLELESWVRGAPSGPWLLEGRADPTHELLPYALIRDVCFDRFGITENDAGPVALGRLEAAFRDLLGPHAERRAHLVGHLIGLDVGSSVHLSQILDDPRQLRDRAFGAVTDIITAMTEHRGAVMLLEDLHWSDQGSLDLVEHLARTCASSPVAIVASARPTLFEKRDAWAATAPHAVRIDLAPLPVAAAGDLVGALLARVDELPEAVRATIVETADGNPYYIEEIVQSLIEDGAIDTTGGEWRLATSHLGDLRVPSTLTGLLQARLDRLSKGERTALQQASVVGRVFWDRAVLSARDAAPEAASSGGGTVEAVLHALENRHLVSEHAASDFVGSREFGFKHAVLRDVVYESVLKRLRARYHGAVAAWLAAQPDAEARAAVIARHYELADAPAECGEWYAAAGTQARLRFANDDAITYYRRAIDTGELAPPRRVDVLDGLADVLMLQARYEEALDAGRAMQAAAQAEGDVRACARALAGISFVQSRRGSNHEALASAREAEALLRNLPEARPEDLADALLPAGWASLRLGDLAAALRCAQEARALAESAGDRRGVSRGLNLQSLVEAALGDHDAAIAHLDEGLAIDRQRGDRRAEGASLINLGESARIRGDFATAAARYEEALAIQRELGDHDMEALSMSNLGGAHTGLGEHGVAVGFLQPALEAFEQSGASENLSETHRFLAEARLGLDEPAAALEHAVRALDIATAAGNPEQTGHAWRVLGRIESRYGGTVHFPEGGPSVDADGAFARSVAVFEEASLERDRAVALADWAVSARAAGAADAGRRLAAARDELERLGLGGLVTRAVAAYEQAATGGPR